MISKSETAYLKLKKVLQKMFIFLILISLATFLYLNNKNKYKGDCINYRDKQFFTTPITIEWTASFDGCLAGCWGGSFTKIPKDSKYPRFSGYVDEKGKSITDRSISVGQKVKIIGNWVDISDSYASVFENYCVPTIEIKNISILDE